jgi:FkbM family methyltransferase
MDYREHLKRRLLRVVRRRAGAFLQRVVGEDIALQFIESRDIALQFIESRFPKSELRLALYDSATGVLSFPESLYEARLILERGTIADAVPWMLKIDPIIPDGGIVFDVGGFRGITSQWFARKSHHVHTFEPMPENAESIRMALKARNVENVSVHQIAVSDRIGTSEFHLCAMKGHNSLGRVNTSAHVGSIQVPTTTLDDFADRNGIGAIDFLKIDVEGFELEVLKGAAKLLSSHGIKGLLFEANKSVLFSIGKSAGPIHDLLSTYGYSVADLDGRPASRSDVDGCEFGDYLARPQSILTNSALSPRAG